MNKRKMLLKVLFLVVFVMITNISIYAQDDSAVGVQNSGGFSFSAFFNNLQDSAQHLQDQLAGIFAAQDHAKQVAADSQENQQAALEKQQTKRQQQEDQLQNLKDRMEMQRETK